ncbi:LAO/AO transport system ATPase [Acanthamoeba castellanii str. Neff]|uniref:LAO/AO transport system ATPase n=1 Tax=Acanthamoeba castellanii (strain ATCC 30010 / Neff) TaxID=1257118 RepID=L8H2I2_ACACF|nr:LAO/AO transport system ATPase [Acanthamoeba castellanii str. Neff]ELR19704.1 LAO/AO transport system ATPase [Acanthamoeba castellanii str. Neff]
MCLRPAGLLLPGLANPLRRPYTTNSEEEERVSALAGRVMRGERRAVAQAVTLVESSRHRDRRTAEALLARLAAATAAPTSSSSCLSRHPTTSTFRVGISGPPGVGKSTFIEALGMRLVEREHQLAVLAVDPSSARTGGSILGDKTRMLRLSNHPDAFVRPSPTRGTLGGVTRYMSETIAICEGAGYDTIIVETVGVGQSETAVEAMVDMFLLLVSPGGGDELQGIKKGVMELADLIVVNKADGDLADAARKTQFEYQSALKLIHPKSFDWMPRVMACSAATGKGVDDVIATFEEYRKTMMETGELWRRREEQKRQWLWRLIADELVDRFKQDPNVQQQLGSLEREVARGTLPVGIAAERLLDLFGHPHQS